VSSIEAKKRKRIKRKKRIRTKIFGTSERPRLTVYRSIRHSYAQLIDDSQQRTILSISTLGKVLKADIGKSYNIEAAKKVGELIAQKALEKNIKRVVFDRNGYLYHGRVKALAEGAREKGLKF
jgi:large subunit ribosomal protein L18